MTNFFVKYHADTMEDMVKFYAELMACGAVEATRKEQGCVRYEYFFPVESLLDNAMTGREGDFDAAKAPVEMLLWETWESREDQAAHTQAPHFALFATLKEKYGITAEFRAEDIA